MSLFDIPPRKFRVACMKMNNAAKEGERATIIETEKRRREIMVK